MAQGRVPSPILSKYVKKINFLKPEHQTASLILIPLSIFSSHSALFPFFIVSHIPLLRVTSFFYIQPTAVFHMVLIVNQLNKVAPIYFLQLVFINSLHPILLLQKNTLVRGLRRPCIQNFRTSLTRYSRLTFRVSPAAFAQRWFNRL